MTLVEHLYELRSRLLRAAVALALATVLAWFFFDPVFDFLKAPYCHVPASHRLGNGCTLVVTGVFDAFFLRLKVSLLVGIVLASPVWLYQIWAFVGPGLHRNERRWAYAFLATSGPLFFAGAALAYLTLNKGLALLLGLAPGGVIPLIHVTQYLSYATMMLLIFGASFEFPLIVVLLNFAGVLSYARMRRMWRGIIFGVFVFAAVATPSQDPFTMAAMAIPMCVLFGAALLVARVHDRRKAARELAGEGSPYAGLADDELSPLDAS